MLIGEKTRLRAVLRADLSALHQLYREPSIIRFVDSRGDVSLEHLEARLEARLEEKRPNGEWLVIEDEEGTIIGSISYGYRWRQSMMELSGFYIAKGHQNKGYGTDALKRLYKFLFEEKEVRRIEALIREDNLPALKAFEKAGFMQEGIRRKSAFSGGKYLNEVFVAILAKDYLEE